MESMNIKIDKALPIPEGHYATLAGAMRRLEVGDSLVVPPNYGKLAAYRNAERLKIRITTRMQPDGTQRVWRIK
jgi:hypothetical protein